MTSKEDSKAAPGEERRRSPLDHLPPPANSNKPLTPFSIEDILNKPSVRRSYSLCGAAHLLAAADKLRPPPQQTLLAQLLTPKHHRGRPPTVDPTTRGGAPSRRGSLPLPPFFPSHPAPHGWRRGSRAGRGEATDTALGTDHVNDPSAGSPTETLLRLLLPLDSQVRPSSQRSARAVGRPRRGRSEGLTKPSNR